MVPWFYETSLTSSPAIIVYGVAGVLYFARALSWLAQKTGFRPSRLLPSCCFRQTYVYVGDEDFSFDWEQRVVFQKINLILVIATFLTWFLLEYSFYIGRFNFLLKNASQYEAMLLPNGDLVYPGPKFYQILGLPTDSDVSEIIDSGCDFLLNKNGTSPWELATVTPAPDNICSFSVLATIQISANILDGFSKFSIGLGLAIFLLAQAAVLYNTCQPLLRHDDESSGSDDKPWFLTLVEYSLESIFFLMICSQQSVVLIPLTMMSVSDYCFSFNMPLGFSVNKAVCYYRWSCAGIPAGLPFSLVGVLLLRCGSQSGEKNALGIMFAIAGFFVFVTGMALLGVWLCVGIGLGIYFHFGSFFLQRIFLVAELFAPSHKLLKAILDLVTRLVLDVLSFLDECICLYHCFARRCRRCSCGRSNDDDDRIRLSGSEGDEDSESPPSYSTF